MKPLSTGEMEVPPPSDRLLKMMQRLVFFLSLLVYLPPVWAQSPPPDTLALLRFKQQLGADPSGNVNSWDVNALDANGCPKNWYGVNCSDQGKVIRVVLENLALQGELNSGTLGSLTGLLYLSLSNNKFRGNLPNDLGTLSSIEYVNLSENSFDGTIPSSLVQLPMLKNLSLAGNNLSGPIPLQLAPSLNELDLSRNSLSGELPNSLSQLQQLVALNLSQNNLAGSIPSSLQNLAELERLDIHENQLSGSIDPALLSLKKARYVDLSANKFSGRLPWQQSGPSSFGIVEHVNLSYNQLSDSLMSDAGVLFAPSLSVLDISYNQLFGQLPSFLYTALTILKLSNNAFDGSVPATLLTKNYLKELDLSANQLTGPIESVTNGWLITLNLSKNNLNGVLPTSLGQCESVDLSFNNFSGDLSVMQNWGQNIKALDLSSNALAGSLPATAIYQLFQLTRLNLSHNRFSGPVANDFGPRVLSILDLSFNQLQGDIPSSFFYSALTQLVLSHNQLVGPLPLSDASISTVFSPLTVLDLSNNGLNGSIPGKIGSLSTLIILNLSVNKLSGPIPRLPESSSLQGLYLSENHLSGSLPQQLPMSIMELNVSRNDLSGSVPKNLTRFPQSSFFPGNSALHWPLSGPQSASPGPFIGKIGGNGGLKSAAKAGLIVGCTAGAVLVIALGVFIYSKSPLKSSDSSSRSEFGGTQKGFERCGKPGNHTVSGFDGDIEHGAPDILPAVATGKSVSSRKGKSIPTENGSPELKLENEIVGGDLFTARNHLLPSVTEDVMSPEHPLVSKVSPEHPLGSKISPEHPLGSKVSPEHQMDLKVASQEQLVGDICFLDKTLSFSSSDLSRAPAEVLGRSSHGTSYKATISPDLIIVAKWLKEGLAKGKKDFGAEAKKFANIKHQSIVGLKGYYWGPREHEKLILSEYIVGGSLAGRLFETTRQSQPPLTWIQRLKIAVDISCGLLYLHGQHRWAHGNIKASNVLLTEDSCFEARLSDYSLHRLMTPAGTANHIVNAVALGYCAPELSAAKNPKPSIKSDVFSFGVILMELITGKSAGDIISGSTGVVDLPDWVKLVANEGHAIDCYDTALVGVDRDLEPPKGIEHMLAISLNCAAPPSSRPTIRVVYEELAAINPN